ncbi:uncharacterized protein CcaverHIS019_0504680 [Cutaneotrichosporon cavernicola]|uniref:Uncharacterized protein n=1 Tax=Cutaneotrichosporon cavernicola TaxID=279322 RepID=A0AA48L6J2_9TREE|nr:uncharacterized protein CcaverHIS019_0504680 [Cutaneotrichosporon cavernicola]BEI92840.1 hypothetical protein CcaverHIS019_0504680 [Cutaneotrichosporon cavernicola]
MGKDTRLKNIKNTKAKAERNPRSRRPAARPRRRRARSSSSAESDLLETPPPPPALTIPVVGEDDIPPLLPVEEKPSQQLDLLDILPPAPPPGQRPGPVCESRTCTSFYFAGHLDNRSQWQILHQALVTYMYELNMSPQVAWHNHRTGEFRGREQKYTILNVVTGSTWTNVFEKDVEGLIRIVWQGGDRKIEVYRSAHE